MKHGLVEEGWGELLATQGADDQPNPLPQTLEQLEMEQPETLPGEPDQLAEGAGNSIPREQALTQSRITGFLIPAPSHGSEDWPTTDNLVTRDHQDLLSNI